MDGGDVVGASDLAIIVPKCVIRCRPIVTIVVHVLSFHSYGCVISYIEILSDLQFVLHAGTFSYLLVQIYEDMTLASPVLLQLL